MSNVKAETVVNKKSNFKASTQKFGGFMAGMIIPNIGAILAWGLITMFVIPTGWTPSEKLAVMVGPMIKWLIPILVGFTGGRLVHGIRGGVVGAIATCGIIVGSDIPMILGGMIMGPLGGWIIKKFDQLVEGKIRTGFEMLVDTFSAGILGALISIFAFLVAEPIVTGISTTLGNIAAAVTEAGLLPLIAIVIEPGKILFLNNAINFGVLGPLGIQQVTEMGKSVFFLLESNPGPGMGILLAYCIFGKGAARQSAPGAAIIHFLGGIHEVYFPYILMKPILILAAIGGGISANFTFVLLNAGLVATPSPGSIFAQMAMSPKGGHLPVLAGIVVGGIVSFLIASVILKRDKSMGEMDQDSLNMAKNLTAMMKAESKGQQTSNVSAPALSTNVPKIIVFACEAGMGSSAMGESILKKKIKEAGLAIEVKHSAVNAVPANTEVIFTQESLAARAAQVAPNAEIVTVKNFLEQTAYDEYLSRFKK
ncbi:MAG: system D-mannitol-specific component, Fru family [Bacillota bacterium]|jgi:PTS system mannitol-specific IIC component|nr:system D-mannitol-specific component, Fru family [Bacillota bacterium]